MIQLLYDPRDDPYHKRVGSQILYWLDDLGAIPLNEAGPGSCAGTAHENVFKSVAARLRGEFGDLRGDHLGGPL